jgi:hypothetical protein
MSERDDLYGVTQPPISDELAERLMSGNLAREDAAPELDTVLGALRAPADRFELSGLDAAVVAFRRAVVTPIAGPSTVRTRPMRKKLITARAVATLGAVTLMSAGAAAAATGTVPSPFASDRAQEVTTEHVPEIARESVAKHIAEAAAVTEPASAVALAPTDPADPIDETDAVEGVGPDATGPAKYGLCTAYAAHVEHRDATEPDDEVPALSVHVPVPFQNLTDAATADGQTVEEFCADAAPGKSEAAPGQAAETPSATAPGQTGETPSATAPGQTGETPAVTAPGQAGDNPSATAPGKSDNPSATAPASGADDNPSTNKGRP